MVCRGWAWGLQARGWARGWAGIEQGVSRGWAWGLHARVWAKGGQGGGRECRQGGPRIWARVGRGGQGCEQVVLSIVGSSCEYDMCCS